MNGKWKSHGNMDGWKYGNKCINASFVQYMFGECEWLHGYPSMWYDLLCYMGFHVIHQEHGFGRMGV
jgi:hypothetical protein